MSNLYSKIAIITGLISVSAGATVAIATEGEEMNTLPPAPISCSIDTKVDQGMYVIEANIASVEPAIGQFSFHVSGGANGNRSQIRQGGAFETHIEEPTTVGRIRLGAQNAKYDLTLSVESELGTDYCDVTLG